MRQSNVVFGEGYIENKIQIHFLLSCSSYGPKNDFQIVRTCPPKKERNDMLQKVISFVACA